MDYILQAPLSMGFSRQEYWSGLLFPSLGDLPDPGIKPVYPELTRRFFTTEPPGQHTLVDSEKKKRKDLGISLIFQN